MKEETNNELVGDSVHLVGRLEVFWKAILELEKKTKNSIDDFDDLLMPIRKGQWKCGNMLGIIRHSSPLAPIMAALPHLHFLDKTLLDYYQSGTRHGSYPALYVRKETEPRLPNNPEICLGDSMPAVTGVLEAVQPEFTSDGVWELILLMELGDQFNLVWHAGYSELRIICDMAEFFAGRYFGDEDTCYFEVNKLSEDEKQELLSWNIVPKVKLKNDYALVDYCVFSPFGGFFKVQRKVLFKPQLRLTKPIKKKEISYNCGIHF